MFREPVEREDIDERAPEYRELLALVLTIQAD